MKQGLCPDMPLMVNDWLSSTALNLMTPAQEGAYLRLLCHAWNDPDCTLPDNDDELAMLSRLGSEWSAAARVKACFVKDPERPGRIYNEKQRNTRVLQATRIKGASEHGKKAVDARWHKKAAFNPGKTPQEPQKQYPSNTRVEPEVIPGDTSSPIPPLPSLSTEPPIAPQGAVEGNVELPPHFPKTAQEAIDQCMAYAIPKELILEFWNELMAFSGCDRGKPVEKFGRYCEYRYRKRQNCNGALALGNAVIPRNVGRPPTITELKTQLDALKQSYDKSPGKRGNIGCERATQAEKEEASKMNREIQEMEKRIANYGKPQT